MVTASLPLENYAMKTRRDFIKGVAIAGAVSGVGIESAASAAAAEGQAANTVSALPPSNSAEAMEADVPEGYSEAEAAHYFVEHATSDFMVDVVKSLGIEYIASNPGSSHRGFQESVINHGGNSSPEWLTCLHEESSVAMSHGYAKRSYKPMAMACHGTVGLQHAAMAVYNAFCDRVPLIIFGGNHLDAARPPAGCGMVPCGPGRRQAGTRLLEVGRHTALSPALHGIDDAGLQDCHHAANGTGGHHY